MKARIEMIRDETTGRIRFRLLGSKIAALLGSFAIGLLVVALCVTASRIPGAYRSYGGRVVEIRNDWLTTFFDEEGSPEKCLILEQPDGSVIKRFVSQYVVFQQRIEVGDYVVKERGFFKKPRARDKETMSEMLERNRKMIP